MYYLLHLFDLRRRATAEQCLDYHQGTFGALIKRGWVTFSPGSLSFILTRDGRDVLASFEHADVLRKGHYDTWGRIAHDLVSRSGKLRIVARRHDADATYHRKSA